MHYSPLYAVNDGADCLSEKTLIQTSQCTLHSGHMVCDVYITSLGKKTARVQLSLAKLIAADGSTVRGYFARHKQSLSHTADIKLPVRTRQIFSIKFPVAEFDLTHVQLSVSVEISGMKKELNFFSLPLRTIR